MKTVLKRAGISILIGIALTLSIGMFQYVVLDRLVLGNASICGNSPLCDPSANRPIGFPWAYGKYDDSSARTIVLSFTNEPSVEDKELVPRYYSGFMADVVLYTVLAFGAIVLLTRVRKK